MDYNNIKKKLKNVYFINGTAYAGKSSVCKLLANKYNMIHCEENYKFNEFLKRTTPKTHPNMNYFNTMKSWEEFVTRERDEYIAWLNGVSRETTEFEIEELLSLVASGKRIIVDTNIPHEVLAQISDREHVAYMVATPEISTYEWFNREDEEKQFLLDVIKNTDEPEINLKKFQDTLAYANRQEVIDEFINSGFFVVKRESVDDDIMEKLALIEEHFGLISNSNEHVLK